MAKSLLYQKTLGRYLLLKNRTVVPLRAVAEALDCDVEWVENVVIINKIDKEPPKVEVTSHFNPDQLLDLTIRVNLFLVGTS